MPSLAPFAPLLLALTFCASLVWALCANITYSIDTTHVRVLFFGCTLRKIALNDIEFADKSWKWWNEHYNNSLIPSRIIRIRRRSGWIRNFIITPHAPDVFLSDLASKGVPVR
jgi:hypothetical protein